MEEDILRLYVNDGKIYQNIIINYYFFHSTYFFIYYYNNLIIEIFGMI